MTYLGVCPLELLLGLNYEWSDLRYQPRILAQVEFFLTVAVILPLSFVILGVRQHVAHIYVLHRLKNNRNQSVVVPINVEDNAIAVHIGVAKESRTSAKCFQSARLVTLCHSIKGDWKRHVKSGRNCSNTSFQCSDEVGNIRIPQCLPELSQDIQPVSLYISRDLPLQRVEQILQLIRRHIEVSLPFI